MNIIANENVYDPIVEFLVSVGHNVVNTKRTSLAGAPDEEIYARAVKEQLVIVTMDKDFARLLRFPPERCGGIIVAKLYRLLLDETTEIFKRHFQSLNEENIRGKLVIMTRDGVRIHR